MWMLWSVALAAPPGDLAFLSYGDVPTWKGVVSDLQGDPQVHLFDTETYPGHADFVSTGLKTGITFKQFKEEVQRHDRDYVPFFLYDLGGGLQIDGRTSTWAVRIEDYGYSDSVEDLAQDVLQTLDLVAKAYGLPKTEALVVLANSQRVRPGRDMVPLVTEAGYVHAPLTTLQKAAPPIQV